MMDADFRKVDASRLAEVCRRYSVRRLAVFGSALRNELRPDSDLDVLVEFEEGKTPGYGFFHLEDELSDLFGRKVDLNTPGFLHRFFRQQVQEEAAVLYAA